MPLYDYQCPKCGRGIELLHSMYRKPRIKCSRCNTAIVKVIGGTPMVRLNWKASDSGHRGKTGLNIHAGKRGKSTPLSEIAGGRK